VLGEDPGISGVDHVLGESVEMAAARPVRIASEAILVASLMKARPAPRPIQRPPVRLEREPGRVPPSRQLPASQEDP